MKNHILVAVALTTTLLVSMGCSEKEPSTSNSSHADEFSSTYEGLQTKLFDGQGCTNDACHGVAAVGGLDLRADVSFSQLVDVESTGSELKRVELGLRGRSYLYLKLLAASKPEDASINGAPMPSSEAPIPDNLLEALRLWIYAGAPETGTVPGTAELLGLELPPPKPITIEPLPKPAADEGFQLELPNWPVGAYSEREVCFASYYDIRDQVPDEFKDETGNFAFVNIDELRQDPQSHHLILNRSFVPVENINAPELANGVAVVGSKQATSANLRISMVVAQGTARLNQWMDLPVLVLVRRFKGAVLLELQCRLVGPRNHRTIIDSPKGFTGWFPYMAFCIGIHTPLISPTKTT